ncbi:MULTISPECIES: SIS domain-containing protein [Streptomyces]|uniref:Mannose-6-phosphate isomerase n=1 Tax=Streptomyces morookaense TaxID=1970 RepID=A0A7Y7B782_STRMO|nr:MULTISPECIES: SIS domain-containing protein [Streptomyces]MCC2278548.1 mannose-6-phosphate isomerase [Streptomyces sp. ET3-23]NVK80302.1 mannose-6-phosphate isomerase [Streptomyces morookaense]GHF11138.1 bifunctional glucose-6-phosphate/mannose-6-phosphate isomerase [Streptomyces morookaense]
MFDESLLDDPDGLSRADLHGLLRGAAESGARVRTAVRNATEAGIGSLQPDGRPRAVLVAGPGPAAGSTAELLSALADGSCPVALIRPAGVAPAPGALRWTLPGWTGPLDLLLVASPDGTEPGLAVLLEQAYRRGCTVVSVSPAGSPLAEATAQVRGLAVPLTATPYEAAAARGGDAYEGTRAVLPTGPGTLWSLLTPLLALADRLGLFSAPPETLEALADHLDQVAERCGPAIATYSNPAKTLAAEVADTLPLIWSEGELAAAAGRRFATVLAALAGRPALAAELPEALTAHGALLSGAFAAGADPEDFFRDRVEEQEAALHARVVLLREREPDVTSPAPAARELALHRDTPVSELEATEGSSALETAAELLSITDFAAVYLALASTS